MKSSQPLKPVTITYLEMRSPGELRPKTCPDPRFEIKEAIAKQWEFNRSLYLLVGRDWNWNDKRNWTPQQWQTYSESAGLRTFAAHYDGSIAGYYELRLDNAKNEVEIGILGLTPKFVGRGFGGPLVTSALSQAWSLQPARVWLHTCTLDHPAALHNYQARGLRIYKTERVMVP